MNIALLRQEVLHPIRLPACHGLARLLLVVLGMLAAGCRDQQRMMAERMAPDEAERFARGWIMDLHQGRLQAAADVTQPQDARIDVPTQLLQMSRLVRDRPVRGIELVGYEASVMGGVRRDQLVYQLSLADGWIIALVNLRSSGGRYVVESANFSPAPASLQEINAFSLTGKSPLHYVFLLLTLAAPVFCLFAAVRVARTRMRRRWLWVLVALIGVATFRIDWTTGQWDVLPLNFQLFSAGFTRSTMYGSWILTLSLPLGAALALWRRGRALRSQETGAGERGAGAEPDGLQSA